MANLSVDLSVEGGHDDGPELLHHVGEEVGHQLLLQRLQVGRHVAEELVHRLWQRGQRYIP